MVDDRIPPLTDEEIRALILARINFERVQAKRRKQIQRYGHLEGYDVIQGHSMTILNPKRREFGE